MLRLSLLCAGLIAAALAAPASLRADETPYVLTIKDHVFQPAVLEVPAGEEFEIIVRNEDATPEEFESIELDREKIVSGGAEIRVRIDALKPGKYDYYGEFHMETAFGQIVAK